MSDRTVHATLSSGDLIVRLDRAGKWYRESEGRRFPITLGLAVELATQKGCTPHLGLSGVKTFDARTIALIKDGERTADAVAFTATRSQEDA